MSNDARVWLVTTTTPTREEAVRIARELVGEHLAAGAEITGPAASVFWHLGELGEGDEWRLTVHCAHARVEKVMARVADLHSWGSPEVSATPIARCLESYALWVEKTTAAAAEQG